MQKWHDITLDVLYPQHQLGDTKFTVSFDVLAERDRQWTAYRGYEIIGEYRTETQAKVACDNANAYAFV